MRVTEELHDVLRKLNQEEWSQLPKNRRVDYKKYHLEHPELHLLDHINLDRRLTEASRNISISLQQSDPSRQIIRAINKNPDRLIQKDVQSDKNIGDWFDNIGEITCLTPERLAELFQEMVNNAVKQ